MANDGAKPVTDYLVRADCLTVRNFFNRCDGVSEIVPNIIAGAYPNPEDDTAIAETRLAQKAKVARAWRESEALVKRVLDKMALGVPVDDLDEPLPDDEHKAVVKTFADTYRWSLAARGMVPDARLGRLRRQFSRWSITVWQISKTASLSQAHRGTEPKRHKLNPDIPLEWVSGVEETTAGDTRRWLRLLKLCTNGWGVAGCFEVECKGSRVFSPTGRRRTRGSPLSTSARGSGASSSRTTRCARRLRRSRRSSASRPSSSRASRSRSRPAAPFCLP